MNPLDKHRDVRDSGLKYRPDIALVEQVLQDGMRLYPHTEQLPGISRAVDREFFEALPERFANTDHRGDDARKNMLRQMATRFCDFKNDVREDGLTLCPVSRRDLVSRVAVVQRITVSEAKGNWHYFRFFADGKIFPHVYFCDAPFTFSSHVLDRYRERVSKTAAMPWSSFLIWILNQWGMVMRVNGRDNAVIFSHPVESMIALIFDPESKGRLLFKTCLTANEISSLEAGDKSMPAYFHFGRMPKSPWKLNLNFAGMADYWIARWKKGTPPSLPTLHLKESGRPECSWHFLVHNAWKNGQLFKIPEGTCHAFIGNFHSLATVGLIPGSPPPHPLEESAPDDEKDDSIAKKETTAPGPAPSQPETPSPAPAP